MTLPQILPPPGPTPNGYARLRWFPAPSGGILGPNAREVGGYHYAIWDRSGNRRMGGTCQPDLAAARAYVLKRAADKGMDAPEVEIYSTGEHTAASVEVLFEDFGGDHIRSNGRLLVHDDGRTALIGDPIRSDTFAAVLLGGYPPHGEDTTGEVLAYAADTQETLRWAPEAFGLRFEEA